MPDFTHVGEYGGFIWPAYALTAVALIWMVADSLIRARMWKARAEGRRKKGAEG